MRYYRTYFCAQQNTYLVKRSPLFPSKSRNEISALSNREGISTPRTSAVIALIITGAIGALPALVLNGCDGREYSQTPLVDW
jgi:hypothetical protein